MKSRSSSSTLVLALLACSVSAVTLAGCGIPKGQYDVAVADAQKERAHTKELEARLEAQQKARAELEGRVKDLEAKATDEQTRAELEELKKQKAAAEARAKLFDDLVKKLKKMTDTGKIDIAVRHGQIVLLLENDVLFDVGKTELKPEGVAAIADLAQALKTVQGRRFVVEGHTDLVPIQTKEFASNWELSTARGVTVTKLLVQKGVPATVLSAAGHAEFDPVTTNASTQGRAKNRRIEISLQPNVEELIALPDVKSLAREPKDPKAEPPQPKPAKPVKPSKPERPRPPKVG